MKIEILKPNHFCLFKEQEVGIAVFGEPANIFCESNNTDYLYVGNQNFGWIDRTGEYHIDNKHLMKRPSETRIIEELKRYGRLVEESLSRNLIKYIHETT